MIPENVLNDYFDERAAAEGKAFTAFCAERGYVRDVLDFTDAQLAEWNAAYDVVAAEWDARRDALFAKYDEAPDAQASGAPVVAAQDL